jgi:hypothetical protein
LDLTVYLLDAPERGMLQEANAAPAPAALASLRKSRRDSKSQRDHDVDYDTGRELGFGSVFINYLCSSVLSVRIGLI